jgi:hypothetical protein
MRLLRWCHNQAILIRTCGSQSVAPARAKIMFDLWLMSVGPFFEPLAQLSFKEIYICILLDLVKVVLLLKPVAQLPSAKLHPSCLFSR